MRAVDDHPALAVFQGTTNPTERGAQVRQADGLAISLGIEVGMFGVERVEQPIREDERVVLERRAAGEAGGVPLQQGPDVPVLAHLLADGRLVGLGDAVELT